MTTTSSADRFRGCFTAVITPFTRDGSAIDFSRLEQQIADQAAGGVTGVVLAGTTGESPTLSEREYHELVEKGVPMVKRHRLMAIVGTGSYNTAHAVEMQKFAKGAGADAALSVNPYYNKPTQEGLYRHFTSIADSADLPIMLYNIPGRAAVALSIDTIVRLAAHPNIQSIKDATGGLEMVTECVLKTPRLAVLSGDDPLTLPMLSVGARGVVSVLSNLLPAKVQGICNAWARGDLAGRTEALRLHQEVWNLTRALFIETNPIGIKTAMMLAGRDLGTLRLPMCAASESTVARLRAEMARMELVRESQ